MPQNYDDWFCGQFRDVEKEKREIEGGKRMKKVLIEEAGNGYVVRFTKYFGDSIITSDVSVYHELAGVGQAITGYFQGD